MAIGIKHTYEYIKEKINDFEYELISTEYINAHSKLDIKDKYGYLYHVKFDNLRMGKIPEKFSTSNPFTIYNLSIFFKENNINSKIITEKYIGTKQNIDMICSCGNKFSKAMNKIISRKSAQCYECADLLRRDSKSYDKSYIIYTFNSYGYKIVEEKDIIRTDTKVSCEDIYGYKYYLSYRNILQRKSQKFHTKNPYTIYNIKKYIEINNLNIELLSDKYYGNLKYMDFRCSCEEVYQTNLSRLIYENAWRCQKCSGYQSTIEFLTETWFVENEIEYESQVTFNDINANTFGKLRFDFKVGDVLIEVDGIQHFEAVEYFGGKEALMKQRERDSIKNKYCENNNFNLIRIPYWEYENSNYKVILYKNIIENNPSKE